jgi:hypothetical protein
VLPAVAAAAAPSAGNLAGGAPPNQGGSLKSRAPSAPTCGLEAEDRPRPRVRAHRAAPRAHGSRGVTPRRVSSHRAARWARDRECARSVAAVLRRNAQISNFAYRDEVDVPNGRRGPRRTPTESSYLAHVRQSKARAARSGTSATQSDEDQRGALATPAPKRRIARAAVMQGKMMW